MGCNQSKKEDIQATRERIPYTPENSRAIPQQIAGKPRAIEGAPFTNSQLETAMLSASYTDRRQQEYDKFRGIVDETVKNLIDVSQDVIPVEREVALERQGMYKALVQDILITREKVGVLPRPLPFPSDGGMTRVVSAGVSQEDLEVINKVKGRLQSVVDQIRVVDCGELVAALPELPPPSSTTSGAVL